MQDVCVLRFWLKGWLGTHECCLTRRVGVLSKSISCRIMVQRLRRFVTLNTRLTAINSCHNQFEDHQEFIDVDLEDCSPELEPQYLRNGRTMIRLTDCDSSSRI